MAISKTQSTLRHHIEAIFAQYKNDQSIKNREAFAKNLLQYVIGLMQDYTREECNKQLLDLNKITNEYVHSGLLVDKLCALEIIDALVDVDGEDHNTKIGRSNSLRILLMSSDTVVYSRGAEVLGHLAQSGGTLMVEYVEFEANRALEWIEKENKHNEARRHAGVLVLTSIAVNAGTLFYNRIPQFLDSVWGNICDTKRELRVDSIKALEHTMNILQKKPSPDQNRWYSKLYADAKNTLRTKQDEAIHGSLLAIAELFKNTSEFASKSAYLDAGEEVFKFADSKSHQVQRAVIAMYPIIAKHNIQLFETHFLHARMSQLLKLLSVLKPKDKALYFDTLGDMVLVLGSRLRPYLDQMLTLLKDVFYAIKKGVKLTEANVFYCLSALVKGIGQFLTSKIQSLLATIDPCLAMMGLSSELVMAYTDIVNYIPTLLPVIQDKLLVQIKTILSKNSPPQVLATLSHQSQLNPSNNTGTNNANIGSGIPQQQHQQLSSQTQLINGVNANGIDTGQSILALSTLGSFDFSGQHLLPFVQGCVVCFIDDEISEIRKVGATTCIKIMHLEMENIVPVIKFYTDILDRLIVAAITDSDAGVRYAVLKQLYNKFDFYMCQSETIKRLCYALNDEDDHVKKLAVRMMGKLSELNPAYAIPPLRKLFIQLLAETEFTDATKRREKSTRLLVHVIIHTKHLMRPYVPSVLISLRARLEDAGPGITTNVLAAIGELSEVGGEEMAYFVDDLLPLVIGFLQDQSSNSRKNVAISTLNMICRNTGAVIRPYKKYPNLMRILFSLLKTEQDPTIKLNLVRVIGTIGAIDPFKLNQAYDESITAVNSKGNRSRERTQDECDAAIARRKNKASTKLKNFGKSKHFPINSEDNPSLVNHDSKGYQYRQHENLTHKNKTNDNISTAMQVKGNANTNALDKGAYCNNKGKRNEYILSHSALTAAAATKTATNTAEGIANLGQEEDVSKSIYASDRDLLTSLGVCNENFYSNVALNCLMRILSDPLLEMYHHAVIQALMYIIRSLDLKTVFFLPKFMPILLNLTRTSNGTLRKSIYANYVVIVQFVKEHIRPYLSELFTIINHAWDDSQTNYLISNNNNTNASNNNEDNGSMINTSSHGTATNTFIAKHPFGGVGSNTTYSSINVNPNSSANINLSTINSHQSHSSGYNTQSDGKSMHGADGANNNMVGINDMKQASAASINFTEYVESVIPLLKSLSYALGQNFKYFLLDLVPKMVRVMVCDDTPQRKLTLHVLSAFESFGVVIEDYLNLILCHLIDFIECEHVHTESRSMGILFIAKMTRTVQFNDYSGLLIQSFNRLLTNSPELRDVVFISLTGLAHQLRRQYTTFMRLIQKTMQKYKLTNRYYDRIAFLILNNYPNVTLEQEYLDYLNNLVNGIDNGREDAGWMQTEDVTDTNTWKKFSVNQNLLKRVWSVTSKNSKEDWNDWVRKMTLEFLRESPSPALRSCSILAQSYTQLARDLFNSSFVSCWSELFETNQDDLIICIKTALDHRKIPTEVSQIFLNLAEFMEHQENKLPLEYGNLGNWAVNCQAYAKALHYKEMEFSEANGNPKRQHELLESFISIYDELRQDASATGILEYIKSHNNNIIQGKSIRKSGLAISPNSSMPADMASTAGVIKIKDAWYENLQQWHQALEIYNARLKLTIDPEAFLGRLRCLNKIGEWKQVHSEAIHRWKHFPEEIQAGLAPIMAEAAWRLGKWDALEKYTNKFEMNKIDSSRPSSVSTNSHANGYPPSHYMHNVNINNGGKAPGVGIISGYKPIYKAMCAIKNNKFDIALDYININREMLEPQLLATFEGENYSRAFKSVFKAQICSELEEVIRYKQADLSERVQIQKTWKKRIYGSQKNIDVWQTLLQIRSLVLLPSENEDLLIKFSAICRKMGQLNTSKQTILTLIDYYLNLDDSANNNNNNNLGVSFDNNRIDDVNRLFGGIVGGHSLTTSSTMGSLGPRRTDNSNLISNLSTSNAIIYNSSTSVALSPSVTENSNLAQSNYKNSPLQYSHTSTTNSGAVSYKHNYNFLFNGELQNREFTKKNVFKLTTTSPLLAFEYLRYCYDISKSSPINNNNNQINNNCNNLLSTKSMQFMADNNTMNRGVLDECNRKPAVMISREDCIQNLDNFIKIVSARDFEFKSPQLGMPTSAAKNHFNSEQETSIQHTAKAILLAKAFKTIGSWQFDLCKDPGEDILNFVLFTYTKACDHAPTWYSAWNAYALVNIKTIHYFERNKENYLAKEVAFNSNNVKDGHKGYVLNQEHQEDRLKGYNDNIRDGVVRAMSGFFRCIALSGGRSLQDTLRTLTLLFKYGTNDDVIRTMKEGIKTSPIETWLYVIPQLIARIHTPSRKIRLLVHDLLVEIGNHHPQALIYSLTVAATTQSDPHKREDALAIVEKLRQNNGRLVDQALLVSNELVRVAILWHEMWHVGLEEASRLWFGEKDFKGMMAILSPLHEMIESRTDTLREVSFNQTYGNELREAFKYTHRYADFLLAYTPTSLKTLDHAMQESYQKELQEGEMLIGKAWEIYYAVFKKIARQLPQLTSLELQYVSPKLLDAVNLELAVPGQYLGFKSTEIVRIMKFSPVLNVIASKQRPRKLSLMGSDGKLYIFMLKGHEDLRQDERVMQLFDLLNSLLAQDPETFKKGLTIKKYAVIPLSTKSGLIGWVSNCDTLHAQIKEYRDSKKILLNLEHKMITQMSPAYDLLPVPNKVEVFLNALKFNTGHDLARILWLKSPNSSVWLDKRTNYTRSLAVMSMVGYILGLGDRHPSNIMVERQTGKIVHIDFGDCFEVAMHRDKFPERIPFRLTRMLVNAMEVSGIEGNFRITCIDTMRVLRDNRDSLMAVLEAFVHDPLINWRLIEHAPTNTSINNNSSVTISEKRVGEDKIEIENSNEAYDPRAMLDKMKSLSMEEQQKYTQGMILSDKAVEVINRVEAKLDGRDYSATEILTVEHQVRRLIIEATSTENLCQSYVGWCPFW